MAISALKTWIAGEILLASDLNLEFARIYTNAGSGTQSLGWPATSSKDFDGNILILDADADTTLDAAAVDDRIDIAMKGTDLFRFDGTATTPVNGLSFVAAEASSEPAVTAFGSDTDIDVELTPKGAGNGTVGGTRILLLGDEETAQTILAGQVFG